jgi:hypothetical protein
MATSAQIIVANIVLAIFAFIMIIFGACFVFFMYKRIQPVKARSVTLVAGDRKQQVSVDV